MDYLLVLILVVLNIIFYLLGYWAGYDRCSRTKYIRNSEDEDDGWMRDADWWKK